MTRNVFAGKWEIAAENGMNKSIARFPDVCMSPPSPPAGPIPIPYPDTSFSNNLKKGSSKVKIGGKGAALAQKSYYKEPVLGDEAATRAFGANIITHQITGKTYFQSWCMDVKFEGKNVCRHFDLTTSNHASGGGTTAPLFSVEFADLAAAQTLIDSGKCPCCGKDLHDWQRDPNSTTTPKAPYKATTATQFWQNRINNMPVTTPEQRQARGAMQSALGRFQLLQRNNRETQKRGRPACRNVHANELSGCAIHFDIPLGTRYPSSSGPMTVAKLAAEDFTAERREATRAIWAKKTRRDVPEGTKINHITPRTAGGCNSSSNTVPENVMAENAADTRLRGLCDEIEEFQSQLEKTPV